MSLFRVTDHLHLCQSYNFKFIIVANIDDIVVDLVINLVRFQLFQNVLMLLQCFKHKLSVDVLLHLFFTVFEESVQLDMFFAQFLAQDAANGIHSGHFNFETAFKFELVMVFFVVLL